MPAGTKKARKQATSVKPRRPAKRKKAEPLNLSAFPPEAVLQTERRICLACVLDVFTRHMGLAAKTAHSEIKRYTPTIEELNVPHAVRPYFEGEEKHCPYCGSSSKWHARLSVYRIESGKATDAPRRELVKSLASKDDRFVVLEERATRQEAFFEWLEKMSAALDLDDPKWLREISRHYLARKEPKTDWQAQFEQAHSIRRSRRLESGWEIDGGRLFLAPVLFDELLLVQYLVSRSHRAGGLTLEGRYTLPELFSRLRNAGYLRAVGVQAYSPSDAFEQLLAYLGGGDASLKFYYIVDRRDWLEHANEIKTLRPPRSKAALLR